MSLYLKLLFFFSLLVCSTNASEVRIAVSDLIAGTLIDTLMLCRGEQSTIQD